jgi:hypothetical protein
LRRKRNGAEEEKGREGKGKREEEEQSKDFS